MSEWKINHNMAGTYSVIDENNNEVTVKPTRNDAREIVECHNLSVRAAKIKALQNRIAELEEQTKRECLWDITCADWSTGCGYLTERHGKDLPTKYQIFCQFCGGRVVVK